MLRSPGDFWDALAGALRGDAALEAEAAGHILAETILLHRNWLRAHIKKEE